MTTRRYEDLGDPEKWALMEVLLDGGYLALEGNDLVVTAFGDSWIDDMLQRGDTQPIEAVQS